MTRRPTGRAVTARSGLWSFVRHERPWDRIPGPGGVASVNRLGLVPTADSVSLESSPQLAVALSWPSQEVLPVSVRG